MNNTLTNLRCAAGMAWAAVLLAGLPAARATDDVVVSQTAPLYVAGTPLDVSCTVAFPAGRSLQSLLWTPSLPSGWTLLSVAGDGDPLIDSGGAFAFFGSLSANPVRFSFRVAVPADASGPLHLGTTIEYQLDGMPNPIPSLEPAFTLADVRATHALRGYLAGQRQTVSCSFAYAAGRQLQSLLWVPELPPGWTLISASGADSNPQLDLAMRSITLFGDLSANPVTFSYTVEASAAAVGTNELGGAVEFQLDNMFNPGPTRALPDPLPVPALHTLQIAAEFGESSPAFGVYTNFHGVALTNRSIERVTIGSRTFACAGWTLTGHTPASGPGAECVLTLTNNAVLTWVWVAPLIAPTGTVTAVMDEDGTPVGWSQPAISAEPTRSPAGQPSGELVWGLASPALHGTAVVAGTGTTPAITYQPATNYFGEDRFVVQVADGLGGLDQITVDVTVNSVNDAPVLASIGDWRTDERTPLTFTVSASDADLPTQMLTYTLDATSRSAGMAIDAATGVFTWTPTAGQAGADYTLFPVTVTVTDSGTRPASQSDSETFVITLDSSRATHTTVGFVAGQPLTIDCAFAYPATTGRQLQSLLWKPELPAGWTLVGASGDGSPELDTLDGTLLFSGADLPTHNPVTFRYTVQVPAGTTGPQSVGGLIEYQMDGMANPASVRAQPDPLVVPMLLALPALDVSDKVYDGLTNATVVTYGALAGLIPGHDVQLVTTGAWSYFDAPTAGSIKVVTVGGLALTGAYSSWYAIDRQTVTAAVSQAILIVTATPKTKVYGAANPPLTFLYDGLVNGETAFVLDVVPTATTTVTPLTGVGTHVGAITVFGGADVNYAFTYMPADFTVTEAALTITAFDRSKAYGTAVTFLGTEFTPAGLQNADEVTSVTLASDGAAATAPVAGSPYAITPSAAAGTGLGNYTIRYMAGALTIAKASATIVVNGATLPYDGAEHGATGTATSADGITDLSGLLSLGDKFTNVPGGTASWSFPGDANHNPAAGTVAIVIGKAAQSFVWTLSPLPATSHGGTLNLAGYASGEHGGGYAFEVTAGPGTLNGSLLSFTGLGEVQVRACCLADANHDASDWAATTVQATNAAPLIVQGASVSQTMSEDGSPIAWQTPVIQATDGDGDGMTWTKAGDPANGMASVSGAGPSPTVTYTPTANFAGSDSFGVKVADAFGGANTITVNVTINPVNDLPIFTATITNQTVNEGQSLNLPLAAHDPDLPAQPLLFTLDPASLAAGMTLDALTGLYAWTPTELQGGTSHTVTVHVTDGTLPAAQLLVADGFEDYATGQAINGLGGWLASNAVVTANPARPAGYEGALPLEITHTQTLQVVAGALQLTLASNRSSVVTSELMIKPERMSETQACPPGTQAAFAFNTDGNLDVYHGTLAGAKWTQTWTTVTLAKPAATGEWLRVSLTMDYDSSVPPNPMFQLKLNGVAVVHPLAHQTPSIGGVATGTWFVAAAGSTVGNGGGTQMHALSLQGPCLLDDVLVTASNCAALGDARTFMVQVDEANQPPHLGAIGNHQMNEREPWGFVATASDPDVPQQALTFSLIGQPAGAAISSDGHFSWTPTEAQGPGSYTFDVVVTDNGGNPPALSDRQTLTVEVLGAPACTLAPRSVVYNGDPQAANTPQPVGGTVSAMLYRRDGSSDPWLAEARNAGAYDVQVVVDGDAEHMNGIFEFNQALVVTPLTLTVGGSFTVLDKLYDGTAAAILDSNALTLLSPVAGDDVALLAVAAFVDKLVGNDKNVSLTEASSLSGAAAPNYTLSLADAPTTLADIRFPEIAATQACPGGYSSPSVGKSVVSNSFFYPAGSSVTSLVWRPMLLPGWTVHTVAGHGAPSTDGTNIVFQSPATAPHPLVFTYTLGIPGGAPATNPLAARATFALASMAETLESPVAPDVLLMRRSQSADYQTSLPRQISDWRIDAFEVQRVLKYWRTGGGEYHVTNVTVSTPDGYDVGAAGINPWNHSADYQTTLINRVPDGRIDAFEVQRVLKYWRTGTGAYHGTNVTTSTPDGYDTGAQ